ncbi:MAG TPA: ComEC/Rec2 family competence protein [Candidatus Paceibacterota bacterium]|nr:ComEC/Rec2 family competence protein [Candidatus Paceibacterota bacterium]
MQLNKKEISIIIALIIIALVRFFFFIPKAPIYDKAVGKIVELEGLVSDDPDIRLKNKHLNIKIVDKDVTILVMVGREVEVSYGDMVKVSGVLEEPENFITNRGKEFNYKRYLANQDIYYIIKNAELEILSSGHGNKIKSILYKTRNAFIKKINKVIPMPESDLANGLILGVRGGFDEDTKEEFIETGTIHIVALSGYNVSIVSEGVMKTFSLVFSQVVSIILGIFVIILFIIMTGASSTAIRAGIMGVIMLFGRMTGRAYLAGRALIIAALLMIAYDPRVLVDMSFQLSFIATGGVLYLTPKVIHWFKFLPMRFGIREMFASTVAATISVLPILLYMTGVLSLVSLPTNILILLFIPIAMFFIFLTGIFGFILPIASVFFGYIAYLILAYILFVIHFFGSLSFASISIQSFPLFLTILIYGFLLWWVFRNIGKSFDIP